MGIEFVVKTRDLVQAFSFVRPTPRRTKEARNIVVDVHARKSTIELASERYSISFPAEVVRSGQAHAPIWVLEWFRKTVSTLPGNSVHIAIDEGQMKAENLTYSHPEITVQTRQNQ